MENDLEMRKLIVNVRFIALFASCISLIGLNACSEDEPDQDISFDRAPMLSSLADGLIIPNLQSLNRSVSTLAAASDTFIETTNNANLNALRNTWSIAVEDFQHCTAFGFGPGSLSLGAFPSVLGVFPIDENQVETNILDPEFNLPASFDRDVRGFFAVEYLIYGNNQTDAEIIAGFSAERKAYLSLIVSELASTFTEIVAEWDANYRAEFISSDGTSAGSSISLLYNEFVKDYENLKNFKVELPAGLTAGQTTPEPTLVEAYYSGISTKLLKSHFESTKNIWLGQSRDGQSLIGFEEYLNEVLGGPELVNQTQTAIGAIDNAIEILPNELAPNIESIELASLRDLLQANTPNFKSSMSSLLGISITFNSGDGD